jgi:hypothetical protein
MSASTLSIRLKFNDTTDPRPFDVRLLELCDLRHAAGYQLCGTFADSEEVILIFQLPVVPLWLSLAPA